MLVLVAKFVWSFCLGLLLQWVLTQLRLFLIISRRIVKVNIYLVFSCCHLMIRLELIVRPIYILLPLRLPI